MNVPSGERVGRNLRKGEELIPIDSTGAILKECQQRPDNCQLVRILSPTLSSFINRLRSRSTSSLSTNVRSVEAAPETRLSPGLIVGSGDDVVKQSGGADRAPPSPRIVQSRIVGFTGLVHGGVCDRRGDAPMDGRGGRKMKGGGAERCDGGVGEGGELREGGRRRLRGG